MNDGLFWGGIGFVWGVIVGAVLTMRGVLKGYRR
jgi:hypothetical protein